MAAIHKKVFTSQKGLRSTGGPDLLKWGLPGGGIKSAKVAPTPYVYYPRVRGSFVTCEPAVFCGHKALRVELTLVVMNSFTIQTPQTTLQRQKQARDPRQAQPKRSLPRGLLSVAKVLGQ